ncbi:MAG: alpha/beta fold hydrolase [Turicibacter sp.]
MNKSRLIKLLIEVVLGFFVLLFVLIGTVFIYRRILQTDSVVAGKLYVDEGGISEVREIELGGVTQYISIEGNDLNNPICLFLHGGPGLPIPFGTSAKTQYPELTNVCTAVYWDQRGSGKSYSSDMNGSDITYQRLEFDAVELVDYLRTTFEKEKIYLVGVSWGTLLGMRMIHHYPTKFYEYFGQGQVVDDKTANHLLYAWLTQEFERDGKEVELESLRKIGRPPYKKERSERIFQQLKTESEAYVKKNEGIPGVTMWDWVSIVLASPDLNLKEVYHTLVGGTSFNIEQTPLWIETKDSNLLREIKKVEVPVHFIQGMYDQITPNELVTSLFNQLEAPNKELILFEESAHYLNKNDMILMFEYIGSIIKNNQRLGVHN